MHRVVPRRHLARIAAVTAGGLAAAAALTGPLTGPASASSSPWTVVRTANASTANDDSLSSVAAVSSSDGSTLAMQWNGSTWSVVSTPSGSAAGSLGGVARIPGTSTLWSVGFQTSDPQTDISQTLALRDTSG